MASVSSLTLNKRHDHDVQCWAALRLAPAYSTKVTVGSELLQLGRLVLSLRSPAQWLTFNAGLRSA
jgi:hypothetical protein